MVTWTWVLLLLLRLLCLESKAGGGEVWWNFSSSPRFSPAELIREGSGGFSEAKRSVHRSVRSGARRWELFPLDGWAGGRERLSSFPPSEPTLLFFRIFPKVRIYERRTNEEALFFSNLEACRETILLHQRRLLLYRVNYAGKKLLVCFLLSSRCTFFPE